MRSLARLGVALAVVGVAMLAAPTLGFESIAAERTTTVTVADDANALLGVAATAETPDNKNDAVVVEITNNAGVDFTDLQTDVTLDTTRLSVSDGFDGTLAAGATSGLTLTCDRGGSGTATVTVVSTATGDGLTVQDHEFSHTFEYSCTGGGNSGTRPASFTASDVDETDSNPTQTFTFDVGPLGNKDTATVDLTDSQDNGGIDYTTMTSADVSVTSDQSVRSLEYDPATNRITYEAQGNVGGTIEIRIENFVVDSSTGGTVEYSDSTGRTDSDTFAVIAVAENGQSVDTSGDATVPDGENAGEVSAGGTVDVGSNANVNNGVDAGSDVTIGDDSAVNSGLEAGGDVTTGSSVSVNSDIQVGGSVTLGDDSTANDIEAGGSVTVGQDAIVNEGIDAGGNVYLEDDATVNGDIEAGGTVYVGCDVTLNGDVSAEGGQESTC